MKSHWSTFLAILIPFLPIQGQPQFRKGVIVTTNNEKIEDSLTLSKGQLVALTPGKTKRTYKPAEVSSFKIDTLNYVSYSNDFYRVVISGSKATLYQKLSDNGNEVIYNGTEPVGFLNTTDGMVGDFYIRLATENKLVLIPKSNFKSFGSKFFSDNKKLVTDIRSDHLSYTQIGKIIELYNGN